MKSAIKTAVKSLGYEVLGRGRAHAMERYLRDMMERERINLLLDVGANTGQFASEIRAAGFRGGIISFEPLPAAYDVLTRKAARDANWSVAQRTAIGDHTGSVEIHVAGNSVSSSILDMLPDHTAAEPRSSVVGNETVPIHRLDDIWSGSQQDRPLLKIDVQGFERQVLAGAGQTLALCRAVIVEMSLVPLYGNQVLARELWDILDSKGFDLQFLEAGFRHPQTFQLLQMDGIFVRRDPRRSSRIGDPAVKTNAVNSDSPPIETEGRLRGGLRAKGIFAQGSREFPLVTVMTSVFNNNEHIAGCIESVLRQDYPNIVIDGGSTDGTVDTLRSFDDRVAFWRSVRDKGIYDAWNKGLAEAGGEWICFVGADDELLPGTVTAYMQLARRHPEAEYLSSQIRYVHPSGYTNPRHGRAWSWPAFARAMYVAHPGSMHRRGLYERLGTYDTSYRSAADYELLLRARGTLRAAYMPEVTAIMRGGGVSDNSAALQEAYRARVSTGGRNRLLARLDLWKWTIWFKLFPLRRAMMRWRPE